MKNFKSFIFLSLIFLSSCSGYSSKIKDKSVGSEIISKNYSNDFKPVAYFNGLESSSNDIEINPDANFSDRFIKKLKEAELFSEVSKELPKNERKISLNLISKEKRDVHGFAKSVKEHLIDFSFYSLVPLLPFKYDFESSLQIEAKRWDGKSKIFVAQSNGTSKYYYFADSNEAKQHLESAVLNNNINSIINQMLDEKGFFTGN